MKGHKYAQNQKIIAMMLHSTRCGNAANYEHPVHKDANGNIVDDASLAFGCPVAMYYLHLENVFFLGKTGDNTHGKDDGK